MTQTPEDIARGVISEYEDHIGGRLGAVMRGIGPFIAAAIRDAEERGAAKEREYLAVLAEGYGEGISAKFFAARIRANDPRFGKASCDGI